MNEQSHAAPVTDDSAQKPTVSDLAKDIKNILRQFTQEIDSLAETLPLATAAIERARKDVNNQIRDFLELHGTKRDQGNETMFIVRAGEALNLERLMRKQARSAAARQLVPL